MPCHNNTKVHYHHPSTWSSVTASNEEIYLLKILNIHWLATKHSPLPSSIALIGQKSQQPSQKWTHLFLPVATENTLTTFIQTEDGGSMFLHNAGTFTALYKTPTLTSTTTNKLTLSIALC
jgi:hypothetical protein